MHTVASLSLSHSLSLRFFFFFFIQRLQFFLSFAQTLQVVFPWIPASWCREAAILVRRSRRILGAKQRDKSRRVLDISARSWCHQALPHQAQSRDRQVLRVAASEFWRHHLPNRLLQAPSGHGRAPAQVCLPEDRDPHHCRSYASRRVGNSPVLSAICEKARTGPVRGGLARLVERHNRRGR